MKKIAYVLILPLKIFLGILILFYLGLGWYISVIPSIIAVALKLAIGWEILLRVVSLYLFCLWFVCLLNDTEVVDYAFKLIIKEKD